MKEIMLRVLQDFIREEEGVGVIEVVLILVVNPTPLICGVYCVYKVKNVDNRRP